MLTLRCVPQLRRHRTLWCITCAAWDVSQGSDEVDKGGGHRRNHLCSLACEAWYRVSLLAVPDPRESNLPPQPRCLWRSRTCSTSVLLRCSSGVVGMHVCGLFHDNAHTLANAIVLSWS